jgi:DNA-directed RNA polymerase subunit K/omega
MLHPTIEELTRGKYNRYELALATAKCARLITDEYVRQREAAEKAATGNKDADRNLIKLINKEYRDEKAVKNAISRLHTRLFRKKTRLLNLMHRLRVQSPIRIFHSSI